MTLMSTARTLMISWVVYGSCPGRIWFSSFIFTYRCSVLNTDLLATAFLTIHKLLYFGISGVSFNFRNIVSFSQFQYDANGRTWHPSLYGLAFSIADYDIPGFSNCNANYDLPVGYYPPPGPHPFRQGDPTTPAAVAAPASSQCASVPSPVPQGVTYYWAGGAPRCYCHRYPQRQ
jgi:hypothetical protein